MQWEWVVAVQLIGMVVSYWYEHCDKTSNPKDVNFRTSMGLVKNMAQVDCGYVALN